VTLLLIAASGTIFLRGFKEAIGIAVVLVAIYLTLNLAIVSVGFYEIVPQLSVFSNWRTALFQNYRNPLLMIGMALLVFPKLALGLSGFETGVVVMPLVRGLGLEGRIQNTRKLLTVAALIMSFLLFAS